MPSPLVFFGTKSSSQRRLDTEKIEKIRAGPHSAHLLGTVACLQNEFLGAYFRRLFEARILLQQFGESLGGPVGWQSLIAEPRIACEQPDQSFRLFVRRRAEQ